jgi:hypothetical protein
MRLFDGYIDRRPLMERDGSGVSALLGLDGFVSTAQLLDETSGEWWLAVETCARCGLGESPDRPLPSHAGPAAVPQMGVNRGFSRSLAGESTEELGAENSLVK